MKYPYFIYFQVTFINSQFQKLCSFGIHAKAIQFFVRRVVDLTDLLPFQLRVHVLTSQFGFELLQATLQIDLFEFLLCLLIWIRLRQVKCCFM